MNSVVLMGRITKDLELKTSQSGTSFMSFTIAINRKLSKEKEVDFISCKCFGKTSENIAKFFSKGAMIAVEGRIQTGSYEKDGHKVYTTDVMVDGFHFCGEKREVKGDSYEPEQKQQSGFEAIETDDELPW